MALATGGLSRLTLLKDLISIPERVHKGDFVLKLTEGVDDPARTVHDYVVTPQLTASFDHALRLIESALASRGSKGTYLHGSFGAGKSHFMAVLYLLLRKEPAARALPELAPLLARHAGWLEGRKFLLVPFHLIGARTLEAAILGGYAEHLARIEKDAAPPAIYLDAGILADADKVRARMGDDAFFASLGGNHAGSGWGSLDTPWNAASYETARQAPPGDPLRKALTLALLDTYFSSYRDHAAASGEGFIGIDAGLSEISRHAHSLGYDAVVFFLDELILWLASHSADLPFVQREVQKLVKLVEAERPDRPVPIVSFIARQRDLRELIGEHLPGADQLSFADTLNHWQGRFDTIELENRNLPAIVAKRVLAPKNDEAAKVLELAFEAALRTRSEVVDTWLGSADRAVFKQVYPFSPALIEALVAVSSVLQRERTAIKLLLELLARQRDHLEAEKVVPVGDLWPILLDGDEPFTEVLRQSFEVARKLWRQKWWPVLLACHKLNASDPLPPPDHAFHGSVRLASTLLLAALAPEAPALRGLRVSRLVAMNPGAIRAPIAGHENQMALHRLREWITSGVGEIRIGDEDKDPSVSLELSGIDIESVIERVRGEDSRGNRIRKVRELLFDALGISQQNDTLFTTRNVLFKGTLRTVEVLYTNVREATDDVLHNAGETWRCVLDFPFDEEGYTPQDDRQRCHEFRSTHPASRTLCWLPTFLSRDGLAQLGRLVMIEALLAGERFERSASHLPAADRPAARSLLANQQNQLRVRLMQALESAYGLREADVLIDRGLELGEHLQSLDHTFSPRLPPASRFRDAFDELLRQALGHQFPDHPALGPELCTAKDLKLVYDKALEALEKPDQRLRVDDRKQRELLRRLAQGLEIGTMHEAHFVLEDTWVDRLERFLAQNAGTASPGRKVGELRAMFDLPRKRGLPLEIQNLLLRYLAARTHRDFRLHGGPYRGEQGERLNDDLVLVDQEMPSVVEWDKARERAAALFGKSPPGTLLTTRNLLALAEAVRGEAQRCRGEAQTLWKTLEDLETRLGESGERLNTARLAALELTALADPQLNEAALMRRLASAPAAPPAATLARSNQTAKKVVEVLTDADTWMLFDRVFGRQEARSAELRSALVEVCRRDELAQALPETFAALRRRAVELLTDPPAAAPARLPAARSPDSLPADSSPDSQPADSPLAVTAHGDLVPRTSSGTWRPLEETSEDVWFEGEHGARELEKLATWLRAEPGRRLCGRLRREKREDESV